MVKTGFRSGTIRNVRQYGYISLNNLLTTCATVSLWCYLVIFALWNCKVWTSIR